MGRKKWWGVLNCLSITLILLFHGSGINGDGEVGCLFDKTVCKSLEETCYDDAAFGRCVSPYSLLDSESTYRHNLDPVELELLRSELEKLVADKYQWSHPFTQCIIKTTLNSIRYKTTSETSICDDFDGSPSSPLVDYFENSQEKIDDMNDNRLSPLAVVNFMPTRGHGYGDFANERYYPPAPSLDEILPKLPTDDFTNYRLERLKINRQPLTFLEDENESNDLDESSDDEKYDEQLYELSKKLQDEAKAIKAAAETKMLRSRRQSRRDAMAFIDPPFDDYSDSFRNNDSRERIRKIVLNNSMIDKVIQDNHDVLVKFFETMQAPRDDDDEGEDKMAEDDEEETMDFEDFPYWQIAEDFAGFKRPERLDVKKPGPYFSTNNYAFKAQTLPPKDENEEGSDGDEEEEEKVRKNYVKKELGEDINIHKYKNVDLDHAYIKFNRDIHTWVEGELVVKTVGKLLGLKLDDLTDVRVGRAEVTFKVNSNHLKMNATKLARSLSKIREELEKIINMNMVEAGIGDKAKITIVIFPQLQTAQPDSRSVIGIIVCVVMGAIAAASIVLIIIIHRQSKTRRKLAGLATPDPEASKDYQELCRARMHAKVPTEKPESPKIISLSRESESNRSSTSSWGGDDPAALSNMDISTGHMVLTYMEDHLKNKDLLDQEWATICAYETDPSSIEIATEKSNIDKNRPNSALPYDHSRIVLNELTNVNNSDYINASTITDHDPRNPAYIATQGPLPQTSSDFWQLVWEQGSVVIVMLTRLTEEGKAMCHRYWPEEGSELYHIYEVHLVSEHIWCDDYLVRSFYLKNMRTGETRTVTQFHFLSWPENGVPQSTKALLEFRRKVNKSYRGRSCPIVVHCSDGAGRTGTYCLIDMVLNRMAKGAKEIDLAAALEHIRDQRPGMVSTKQQFEFVLVAVAEEVHAILKALPVQQTDKVQNTSTSSSGSEK